jgi:ribonuclease G
VIKDELGTKGARLTTQLTFPSRLLVLMPYKEHIGISQRIENESERERLKTLIRSEALPLMKTAFHSKSSGLMNGYIIRTAAESATQKELITDIHFLNKLWLQVSEKIKQSKTPCLVHEDLDLSRRFVRDLSLATVEKIRIDSKKAYQQLLVFFNEFIPEMAQHLELYTGERPLFDVFNVEDDIKKALECKVSLKSGGYLILEQTEAMVTIDVNTGAFVGYRNLEDTVFKTNLEAASALARQIRLRNLGGIIIIDFIDMKEEEHKKQVLKTLKKAIEKDYAKINISEVSKLGLVQMTRKRNRESLEQTLCETCPTCSNRGKIKTPQTICYEILRELQRSDKAYEAKKYLVLASQEVVDRMHDEETTHLAELESMINKSIRFQAESLYMQEQFDVVLI